MNGNLFKYFKTPVNDIELPTKFTFPFNYEAHSLAKIAAEELQAHLLSQNEWQHDFGLKQHTEQSLGKMFGVLVVQNKKNELGYIAAFSGKLAGQSTLPFFVPPILDLQIEGNFFKIGENQINLINTEIKALEQEPQYLDQLAHSQKEEKQAQKEISEFRLAMKEAKAIRNAKRATAQNTVDAEAFEALKEELKNESLKLQYDYKVLVKLWNKRLEANKAALLPFEDKINQCKELRKAKSADLQGQLFNKYQFLNCSGNSISVADIFKNTPNKVPPAGAGECAAPKLFQYAFEQGLQPICMAEFWWGESPKSEIRKHGNFYPSCRGKCEPILGHMLKGMELDTNPALMLAKPKGALEIIYEDDDLVAINKPHEFLSIPGKQEIDSVYTRIQKMYPKATGPIIVHRLDMSTSGIMVLTKNKEAHENLQKQFLNRQVVKRYIALLDGEIKEREGHIKLPLRVDLDNRPQQLVCFSHGKPAVTRWQVIGLENGKTRIHFFPLTGRTHQLRVHAAHPSGLNTAIVGDDLYGTRSSRLFLHAEYIKFRHPKTHKTIIIQTDPSF